jgi:hypothetical protein
MTLRSRCKNRAQYGFTFAADGSRRRDDGAITVS